MIHDITLLDIILLISCIIFAIIGYHKKIIDKKVLILILLFAAYFIILFPLYWFIPLFLLYIVTSIATQYKRRTKKLPEKKGRKLKNILSNLLPSFICSFIFIFFMVYFQKADSVLMTSIFVAYLSGIACANADTMSSELGQTSKKKPILITTFKKVETGTDGGITLFGLFVGVIGSMLVSLPALALDTANVFLITSVTGFIGCNIDSLIGASIELKGKCTNETTNLIATTSSSIIGFIIYMASFA